jgi:hypothetical protein
MDKEDYLDKSWNRNLERLNKIRNKPEINFEFKTKTVKLKEKKVIEIKNVVYDFHISLSESIAVQRVVMERIKFLKNFFRRKNGSFIVDMNDSTEKYRYDEYKSLTKFYNKLQGKDENAAIFQFVPF